jgi:hypothetical protein
MRNKMFRRGGLKMASSYSVRRVDAKLEEVKRLIEHEGYREAWRILHDNDDSEGIEKYKSIRRPPKPYIYQRNE